MQYLWFVVLGLCFSPLSSSYWKIMIGKQSALTRLNVCFHSGVWGVFLVPIMPVITFNLQLNTCLSAPQLLICSLKTEALNDMPFKCLICNYLLKCFPYVSAMTVRICSLIYLGSSSYTNTVHLAFLPYRSFPAVVILCFWERYKHCGWPCQSLGPKWKLPCSATKAIWSDTKLHPGLVLPRGLRLQAEAALTLLCRKEGRSSRRWSWWHLSLTLAHVPV